MINQLKKLLKKMGIFKYYMSLKRMLFLNKKEKKIEAWNKENRINFYKNLVRPGNLCFDVGANIGNRTEVFLNLGAKVVAIEPQKSCIDILLEKFGKEIIIEKVGLGPEISEMEMFIADESTISTFSKEFIEKTKDNKFRHNSWNQKISIPITTLDILISKYGTPDFCKIDVEGFEPEVLKGLSKAIPKISFEYNVPELSKNVQSCLQQLNNLSTNYRYNYCIGESMKLELSEWVGYKIFSDTIASKQFLTSDFGDIYAILE
jgi:FkbM family methyltransferase